MKLQKFCESLCQKAIRDTFFQNMWFAAKSHES